MRIGFYNPYFDGLGGGERYTLTLASEWSKSHVVELFWDDPDILQKSQKRFQLDMSRVRLVPNIFATNKFFTKMAVSRKYDLIFFLTDGSVPTSLASHNILHFQVPFAHISTNAYKLSRISYVVCNSKYTMSHIDPQIATLAHVIYPPVAPVPTPKHNRKEKLILSVGRFSSVHEIKKQSVMIDAFIHMEHRVPDWKLVLAGGLLASDAMYYSALRKKSSGHRIQLVANSSHSRLDALYNASSLYWHAAGYGESDPRYAEHFGISTVEAMSARAVPIVYNGGGQTEIVTHNTDGMLWSTPQELINFSLEVIGDKKLYIRMQTHAQERWKQFSPDAFIASYDRLISRW